MKFLLFASLHPKCQDMCSYPSFNRWSLTQLSPKSRGKQYLEWDHTCTCWNTSLCCLHVYRSAKWALEIFIRIRVQRFATSQSMRTANNTCMQDALWILYYCANVEYTSRPTLHLHKTLRYLLLQDHHTFRLHLVSCGMQDQLSSSPHEIPPALASKSIVTTLPTFAVLASSWLTRFVDAIKHGTSRS